MPPKAIKKGPTMAPLKTPGAGSNAQSIAYSKAMASAIKKTKVFGVPGAK